MNIAQLRREYMSQGLNKKDLDPSPFKQFSQWLQQAQQAAIQDPTAMSIATVGADDQPSTRNVLLKGFDEQGFVFYTNLESRKAQQINENNKVALLFSWLPLNRQIKIEGVAEKLSAAQSLKYFLSRPKESQWAAWASDQSRAISSRQVLEEKFFEMKKKFSQGDIPLPSFWGGYQVKAQKIEFWQGRENRLHDRLLYIKTNNNHWIIERLCP